MARQTYSRRHAAEYSNSSKAIVRHLSLACSLSELDDELVALMDLNVKHFAYDMRSRTSGACECDDRDTVESYLSDG